MSNVVCSDCVFSVAAGSARIAELVEVFPLHKGSAHTVGKVWRIVCFLEELSVFQVMIVWVYRIIDGDEVLEESNGLSLIKNLCGGEEKA